MGGSQDNRISEGCLEQVLGICPRHADVRLAEFAWQMLNEMFAGTPCPQKLSCSGNCPVKTPWRASCLACRTRAVLFLPQGACACQWACVLPLPACLAVRPCHPCHARLLLRHGVSNACHATHWNKEKKTPRAPQMGQFPVLPSFVPRAAWLGCCSPVQPTSLVLPVHTGDGPLSWALSLFGTRQLGAGPCLHAWAPRQPHQERR